MRLHLLAVCLAMLVGMKSLAQQPAAPTRTDALGDPLPERALFRLGTTRLQHAGSVRSLAVSDDGRLIASAGADRTIRLWNAKDGKPLWKIDTGLWGAWGLAFSHDGKELAAISQTSLVSKLKGDFRRWDVATGRELQRNQDFVPGFSSSTVRVALACLPGGAYLAAETNAANRAEIIVYPPDDPAKARILKGHVGRAMDLAFTRDGATLVSLGEDGTIRYWDPAAGTQIKQAQAPIPKEHGLKGNLASIAVSPDAQTIAVNLPDRWTRLLAVSGGEPRLLPRREEVDSLTFTADGKTLITGGDDHRIRAWDVDARKELPILNEPNSPLHALALTPDGKTAALAEYAGHVVLADVTTGKMLVRRTLAADAGLAFTPDGRRLAVASGAAVAFWDVAGLRSGQAREPSSVLPCVAKIQAFTLSPDGERLATAEENGAARIYHLSGAKPSLTIRPPTRSIHAVAFSPDGRLLATAGSQSTHGMTEPAPQSVRLWNSVTGAELPVAEDLRRTAHSVVFHPGGVSLAAVHLPDAAKAPLRGFDLGGAPGSVEDRMETIRLWALTPSRERFRFVDPLQRKQAEVATGLVIGRSRAVPVAFSRDGRLFVMEGVGGLVVFEVSSGLPRLRLAGHSGAVTGLAFAPDCRTLLSASADGTCLIWDVTGLRTGVQLADAVESVWSRLADTDAALAGRAVWSLVAAPERAVALLRQRLQPAASVDLSQLVADLDAPEFSTRDQATRRLGELGEAAEDALTAKLKTNPNLETSRRIEKLLHALRSLPPSAQVLRLSRAVEVLEHIATPQARALLRELAQGADAARITRDARHALGRLGEESE